MKACFIIFVFLVLSVISFGQATSSATASATIVTSVGAENSGEIDFGHFTTEHTQGVISIGIDGVRTFAGGIKLAANENGAVTFINIIGSSFVYDITVQNDPAMISQKPAMKINVFKMPAMRKNLEDTDNTVYPIGASITVDAAKSYENYAAKLPFSVTVNFN